MWWGIYFIFGVVSAQHLIGDNICTEEERYTVTSEQHFKKNVTIREFVWCMAVPPRCSKYRTVLRDDVRIVEKIRSRPVQRCCPGYFEDDTNTYCIKPLCSKCVNGECVYPEQCHCEPGYSGLSCNQTCPEDKWGVNCQESCLCLKGQCDPKTGSCQCEPFYSGLYCEISALNKSSELQNCQECDELETSQNKTEITEGTEITTISDDNGMSETTQKIETNKYEKDTEKMYPELETVEFNFEIPAEISRTPAEYENNYIENINNTETKTWDEIINIVRPKKINAFSFITTTIGFAILLIIIAIISVLITRYKTKHKFVNKMKFDPSNNNIKRSMYRSTFHAPLPDPPVFQNPVFTMAENKTEKSFTPNVVGMYNNIIDSIEIKYDYPPSTGSYRAASIPDPDSEPLYDEIPASRRPVPVMNTFGPALQTKSPPDSGCQLKMIDADIPI